MPSATNDSNPDRYDLISDDLEAHILKHAEGADCLSMLYTLYDQWTGHTLHEEFLRAEGGRKRAKAAQEGAKKAATWYLANAVEVQKKNRSTSYTNLAVPLHLAAQKRAPQYLKSDDKIRRYLSDAAREWYVDEACRLVKADPELSTAQMVSTLIERAKTSRTVFFLSSESDVAQYLRESIELWYVRRAAKALAEDPTLSRNALAERLRGEAAREAERYFQPLEKVLACLTKAQLGGS